MADGIFSFYRKFEQLGCCFLLLSNLGMAHEGPYYVLLFPAFWHGLQLHYPLGIPVSVVFAIGYVSPQAGSIAHRPCPFWGLLFRHNCKCIPFGHSVLLSAQVSCMEFWRENIDLWGECEHGVIIRESPCDAELVPFTDVAPFSPSSPKARYKA